MGSNAVGGRPFSIAEVAQTLATHIIEGEHMSTLAAISEPLRRLSKPARQGIASKFSGH